MSKTNWGPHTITIDEADRQLAIMALAHLSIERPGFDDALNRIALRFDNQVPSETGDVPRAALYDEFRRLHIPPDPPEPLSDELKRLHQQVDDLQSGMFVNCVYCGHRYGRNDRVPATMADVLKQHIAQCPRHPMSKLLKGCKLSFHALSSLRAVREGIPDAVLDDYIAFLREALASAEPAKKQLTTDQ